jgi:hypothetical protein
VRRDLTGQTFGYWRVLEFSHVSPNRALYWKCQCECGKIQPVAGRHLSNGKSKSCRCKRKELHDDSGENHWAWKGGQKNPGSLAWCNLRLNSLREAQKRHGGAEIASTAEDIGVLWNESLGVCAACGSTPDIRFLFLDHGKWTGKARGFICSGCNTAIGMAGESPERLRHLADYLERTHISLKEAA